MTLVGNLCRSLFLQVPTEIEYDLDETCWLSVVIEAVNISLELPTIPQNLLASLLEGDLDVGGIGGSDVGPQHELLNASCMFGADDPSLWISDVFLAHRAGNLLGALIDDVRWSWLPQAVVNRPGGDLPRRGDRPAAGHVVIHDSLDLPNVCAPHGEILGQGRNAMSPAVGQGCLCDDVP